MTHLQYDGGMKYAPMLALVLAASCARGSAVAPLPQTAWASIARAHDTCTVKEQTLPNLGTAWDLVRISNAADYSSSSSSSSSSYEAWAYAVGEYDSSRYALVLNWDGAVWKQSPAVNPSPKINAFFGVDVVSKNDVWAVGQYLTSSNVLVPLIEHFDGHHWGISPNPSVLPYGGYLSGVNALRANDVWADGALVTSSKGTFVPLVEHWDGNKWIKIDDVFHPKPHHDYLLTGAPILDSGLKDLQIAPIIFDVKKEQLAGLVFRPSETSPWTIHQMVLPKGAINTNVNGISPWGGTIITVGSYGVLGQSLPQPMAQIWNGTSFDVQTLPKVGVAASLAGVAYGKAHAFAYGSYYPKFTSVAEYALGFAYDGKEWSNITFPKISGAFASAVPLPGKSGFWVAGNRFDIKTSTSEGFIDALKCPVF